ncbi:sodium/proton antiporter, CPA1 family [Psychromonas ingrahamii 37]|uniref:Sodium/proton antiporter, CPA1 family n=1 Tax=Psychromonas ingrahamii (strain DSM 17664 / CCUG 51855 / 37) TaxID=357804 RepID=A1SSU4_PSYIN|nr:sodium:proton antiporter [Psychromonas ingrahamii]ABM02559.1 sodium/proton antiporter, CPA1 family [Psychromonas ingrahamii 37]
MVDKITAMLGLVGILSLLCQWIGWKIRLPAILPLLICGLLIGPGLNILKPDELFGELLFPIISLGVAIILFEGALTLNFKELKNHGRMVTHLVSLGTLITWGCIASATHIILEFQWSMAILFGALVVVTGPTVIVPMLRSIKPKTELASILRWEGILIDPVGAVLAVLVFEYISFTSDPAVHILSALATTLVIGLGFGLISGYYLGYLLRNNLLPHYLKNTAVVTIMLGVFVSANLMQEESGLLTVTVMGIVLANMRGVGVSDILEFKETLTVLVISVLFILLAARVDSEALLSLGWQGLVLLLVVLFIARPLSVWCCGLGTSLTKQDKWFLSWMAPRGIVAAAVSSLFAIKLEKIGVEGAELIVPLVFLIIIGTVVIQSLTAGPWAKFLRVNKEKSQGLLIFGASRFSRELAAVLMSKNINMLLADNNWDNIRLARMMNIPVYYGNPASAHALNFLDMTGIGRLLVLSPYTELNPLVVFQYQDLLGKENVYGLDNGDVKKPRHQLSETYRQRLCLFGKTVSYAKLVSLIYQGAVVKSTNLTENFTFTNFRTCYGDSALPLVYIKNEKVFIYTASESIPSSDIELISLLPVSAQHLGTKWAEKQQQVLQEAREQESLSAQSPKSDKNPNHYEKIKTLITKSINHNGKAKKT